MKYKQFNNFWILRIDRGEEIIESITRCCEENNITCGVISGIGAVDQLEIGIYRIREHHFHSKAIEGEFEITSLNGNISENEGSVYLHLHITVADENNVCWGGHLKQAVVSATAEICIMVSNGRLIRKKDSETGLNLIEIN
ncbi:DNA-binding protein [bacterium]|nr:DNA-binding protein [candidate division CSSED10-310 bacterium]